jgi:hypothetical protein
MYTFLLGSVYISCVYNPVLHYWIVWYLFMFVNMFYTVPQCELVLSCQNKRIYYYLEKVIAVYRPQRSLRSENSVTLVKLRSRTSTYMYGKRRLDVAAANLWNSLPDNLRLCQSLNTFKNNFWKHIFLDLFIINMCVVKLLQLQIELSRLFIHKACIATTYIIYLYGMALS